MERRTDQNMIALRRLALTIGIVVALVGAGCAPVGQNVASSDLSAESASPAVEAAADADDAVGSPIATAPPVLPTVAPSLDSVARTASETPAYGLQPAPQPVAQRGSLSNDFDTQAAADACWAGLMPECDRLFSLSPAGSALEVFAAGCGARTQPLGSRCADTFVSADITLGTLLAEGINVRSAPDLDADVIGNLRGSSGGQTSLTGPPIQGWHPIVYHFQHGWIFGAFLFPERAGEAVVRTTTLDPIIVEDSQGRSKSGGTGSFGLVVSRIDDELWQVLLPTGELATLDPGAVEVIAERSES